MNYHVLTLFPEMIEQGLHTSIIGRAMEKGLLSLDAVNIRDFSTDKHKRVDDYIYGGGAGLLTDSNTGGTCLSCHTSGRLYWGYSSRLS